MSEPSVKREIVPGQPVEPDSRFQLPPRSRRVIWIVLACILILLISLAASVILVVFAAVLLALSLRGISDWLSRKSRLSNGPAFALTVIVLAVLCGGLVWLTAPPIARQFNELIVKLPKAVQNYAFELQQYGLGRWLQAQLSTALTRRLFDNVGGVFSSTFGTALNFVLIPIIGIYLAAEMPRYREGLLRLFPKIRRPRASQVLAESGRVLRGWVRGQLISMSVVGVLAFIGLDLLGIPLALSLALLTAFLTFIPTLGPLLSMIPPILLGLAVSPWHAISVFIFYVFLQSAEGYLISPMVQRRVISLPPALLISDQLLLTILFGFWGLLLAAPLTAFGIVLVRMLYLENVLGERSPDI
jgi:predicted PurR-regulated permease PerM